MVRMAEQVVSADPGDVIVALGLGSCIGLALLDERAAVAGLSHIVLPQATGPVRNAAPAKFADTAVDALVEAMLRAGAALPRLRAVLCGGASMFGARPGAPGLQIGERNAERTRAELRRRRIPIRAGDTGGSAGRSVEVHVGSGRVLVRRVGQPTRTL
jgi:chemotaxis protein CheD